MKKLIKIIYLFFSFSSCLLIVFTLLIVNQFNSCNYKTIDFEQTKSTSKNMYILNNDNIVYFSSNGIKSCDREQFQCNKQWENKYILTFDMCKNDINDIVKLKKINVSIFDKTNNIILVPSRIHYARDYNLLDMVSNIDITNNIYNIEIPLCKKNDSKSMIIFVYPITNVEIIDVKISFTFAISSINKNYEISKDSKWEDLKKTEYYQNIIITDLLK